MTTETKTLSGWDRALIAARWCRDKAAEFIVKFGMYVVLWAVFGIAFSVLLYIDGKFSRGLAEGLDDIDPLSFQVMGWAYRIFAAVFLLAATVCIAKGIKGALTFRLLGMCASIIVCLHAFGFGFQALQDRRDDAMAVREVVTLQANNSAEQIALLREQIETTRADRDRQVDRLQASINGIVSDGLNNDQLADVYRADQTKAEDEAKAKINAAEAEIARLASEGNTAQQNVATITADEKPWPALYVGMAQLATWSKEPTDWAIYLCGVGFIIGWVLLAESLVIFLPERIYLMHLKDAEGRDVIDLGASADVPAGHVRVEVPEDEWNAMQAALRDQDKQKKDAANNRSEAAKNRAPIPIAHKGWVREKKKQISELSDSGSSAQDICDETGFATWNEFEAFVRKMFNKKRAAEILGVPLVANADPRAPAPPAEVDEEAEGEWPEAETSEPPVAVADSPQQEEPEPQEYGVTLYDPPANDDPDKEQAA